MSGYDDFSLELKKKHEDNINLQKLTHPERKIPFSYRYFENTECEFHPCHSNADKGHNCLFCKCPQYYYDNCLGIENGYAVILENGYKDCSNCDLPHRADNYDLFMFWEPK